MNSAMLCGSCSCWAGPLLPMGQWNLQDVSSCMTGAGIRNDCVVTWRQSENTQLP